ncbi:hypothetical protein B0H11DRAFT_2225016 [Mycena galericulata]|nr:hypothetical protein B0H11DRAFT_2225016 [Mycena galericulata]
MSRSCQPPAQPTLRTSRSRPNPTSRICPSHALPTPRMAPPPGTTAHIARRDLGNVLLSPHAPFVDTRPQPHVVFVNTESHPHIVFVGTRAHPHVVFVGTCAHPHVAFVDTRPYPHVAFSGSCSARSWMNTAMDNRAIQDPPIVAAYRHCRWQNQTLIVSKRGFQGDLYPSGVGSSHEYRMHAACAELAVTGMPTPCRQWQAQFGKLCRLRIAEQAVPEHRESVQEILWSPLNACPYDPIQ